MNKLTFATISYYALFSLFTFYLQWLSKHFEGASKVMHLVITVLGFIGMILGFSYLIYFGWNLSWIGAIVLFVIGILFGGFIGPKIERMVGGAWVMGLIGMVGMPVSAYLMFQSAARQLA